MNDKTQIVDGVAYRYSSDWIHNLESEDHWRLYWRQQKLMAGLIGPEDRLVELGVGSGFTANYLRARGHSVLTVDIDPEKKPDLVANVATWDFRVDANVLLAFELFEHAPWAVFESAVIRASAAGIDRIFLSVPYCQHELLSLEVRGLLFRPLTLDWRFPRRRIKTEHHFWELGHGDVSRRKLLDLMKSCRFRLEREARFRMLGFFAFSRQE